MSLSNHIKTQAPGWTVRRLAERLGYNERSLQKMYRQNPARLDLWVKGLKHEIEEASRK